MLFIQFRHVAGAPSICRRLACVGLASPPHGAAQEGLCPCVMPGDIKTMERPAFSSAVSGQVVFGLKMPHSHLHLVGLAQELLHLNSCH